MGKSRKLKISNIRLDGNPPSVRFVKKAGMWCKTYFVNGAQKQDWFMTREEASK